MVVLETGLGVAVDGAEVTREGNLVVVGLSGVSSPMVLRLTAR